MQFFAYCLLPISYCLLPIAYCCTLLCCAVHEAAQEEFGAVTEALEKGQCIGVAPEGNRQ